MTDDWLGRSYKWRTAFTHRLLQAYGWTCCICGLPIKPGEESCEHLQPRSKKGITTMENCRPAHRRCNSSIGDRVVEGPAALIESGRNWFK